MRTKLNPEILARARKQDGPSVFYVYVIFRPNGIPCYVGKGRGGRWEDHEKKPHQTNKRLASIIRRAGGNLPKIKVREELTSQEAVDLEILLISILGRGFRGGWLVNATDGGEGVSGPDQETIQRIIRTRVGKPLSEEHRAKLVMAARNREPEIANKIRLSRVGKMRHTEATKAKMSATRKGRVKTTEWLAALSASQRGRPKPHAKEQDKKTGDALRGRPWTAARRAAQVKQVIPLLWVRRGVNGDQ
jgi:hypothetical protein